MKYWFLYILALLLCATILFYPFKHSDTKPIAIDASAPDANVTIIEVTPVPLVAREVCSDAGVQSSNGYTNEQAAEDYYKDCVRFLISPRRPDQKLYYECLCHEWALNVKLSCFHPKSKAEMNKIAMTNEYSLYKEQIEKCSKIR